MLLAAGLGTRLHPLTQELPKPIVPLANRPLGAFAVDHLERVGVRTIVANTHPQPELVESTLRAHAPPTVDLRFSREEALLGTGGGLRQAWSLFPDRNAPVLVMNGDTLFAPALARACRAHEAQDAVATMVLRPTADPASFGAIGIDDEGVVRALLGLPQQEAPLRELMFTGVHILSPRAFADLPVSGCVIRSAYRRWVDQGETVLGIVDDSPWADLGTPHEYHRANLELASGRRSWPGVDPAAGNLIASGVAWSDAEVRASVIGEGAIVAPGVAIARCVVWPGATVENDAREAIITPRTQLVLG
ncbi:MAG: NDP-sugar synthase [Polyangiales bacterium]